VQALPVIEHLDVIEDLGARLLTIFEALMVRELWCLESDVSVPSLGIRSRQVPSVC
jgi:hypothetical protein